MQRIITIVGFILLFAIGIAYLALGVAVDRGVYEIPSDPQMAVILLASLVGVLILTVATGFGIAQAFGLLSKQIGTPLSPDDRPEIETRALSLLDRLGSATGKALKSVGYGDSEPLKPYTPGYSFKPQAEDAETRQFSRWMGVAIVLLLLYTARTYRDRWLDILREVNSTVWIITGISIAAILLLTILLGAGLAFWFVRTHQEKDKAAKLDAPAWPAAQIAELERRLKNRFTRSAG